MNLAAVVFIALVGAGAVAWLAIHPKVLAWLTVVVTLLEPALINLTALQILGNADELLILMSLVIMPLHAIVKKRRLVLLPGTGFFVAFVVLGFASALIHSVPVPLMVEDMFLLLKGVFFGWAVAQLSWSRADLKKIVIGGTVFIVFVVVCALLNAASPTAWATRLQAAEGVRGGIESLVGPFTHPGSFGQVMTLAAIAIAAYRAQVRKSALSLVLLLTSGLGVLLSTRRKAIVGLLVVAVWLAARRNAILTWLGVALIAPIVLIASWTFIADAFHAVWVEYFENPDAAARTVLYVDAFKVAASNFPLGVGFGRYGTYLAGVNYSPEYVKLGFGGVWGLQPGGSFLTDTFWPAAVGETGFFGAAAFLCGLVAIGRTTYAKLNTRLSPLERWLGFVCAGWSIEYLVESVASQVYGSPPTYLILFGAVGVAVALAASPEATTPQMAAADTFRARETLEEPGRRRAGSKASARNAR